MKCPSLKNNVIVKFIVSQMFVLWVFVVLLILVMCFNRTYYNTGKAVKQHLLSVMFGLNTVLVSATVVVVGFWFLNNSNFGEVIFCWAVLCGFTYGVKQ